MPPSNPPPSKRRGACSREKAAGLHLSVSQVERRLRKAKISNRVSAGASVFATASIELLLKRVLKTMAKNAVAKKEKRLTIAHVMQAIRSDPSVGAVFGGFVCVGDAEVNCKGHKTSTLILTKQQLEKRKALSLAASAKRKAEREAEGAAVEAA